MNIINFIFFIYIIFLEDINSIMANLIKNDKILNSKTGRYVSVNSVIGKKILKETEKKPKEGYEYINGKLYKKCKEGQIRNPITNRCIINKNVKSKSKKETEKKPNEGYEYINGKLYKKCKDGKVRNPITNRCIKPPKTILKSKPKPKPISKPIKRFTTYMNFPLNYEFNKSNVEKFLNACDNETRPLAKKIIDNTRHVSFEEMIKNLNKNIQDLNDVINKDRPIFVFINLAYKEKSNYWIYLYLKDYVEYKYPTRNIILLSNNNIAEHKQLKDNDTIVFIDDCIYTGMQMYQNINSLYTLYDFQKLDKIHKDDKLHRLKLNIYVLTSFMSKNVEKLLKSIGYFNIILNKHIEYIPFIDDFLSYNELKLLNKYYKFNYKYNNVINKYIVEDFRSKYLIYFDHKLADTISTIPLFYSGVVPNTFNKNLFSTSEQIEPKNLEIIPLFKNCEKIRNTNRMKPECPSTPYKKKENKEFMKNIDKKKKGLSY